MRTTIALDDQVLDAAKEQARRCGQSLGAFVEVAVRRELARQQSPRPQQRPKIPTFTRGAGLRPGVDITSTRALLEVLDEGTPVEDLR
ncbi:MAG: CopG family transcriptional regulator [Micromonosporaceae bacterium]